MCEVSLQTGGSAQVEANPHTGTSGVVGQTHCDPLKTAASGVRLGSESPFTANFSYTTEEECR